MTIHVLVQAAITSTERYAELLVQSTIKRRFPQLTTHLVLVGNSCPIFGWDTVHVSPFTRGCRGTTDYFLGLNLIPDQDYLIRLNLDADLLEIPTIPQLPIIEGDWLAGTYRECNDIDQYMPEIGRPQQDKYRYIDGDFIMAPYRTWQDFYKLIPWDIEHYCEDSVFSQLVGTMIEIPQVWQHRHRESLDQILATLKNHL